ncbi:MAG: hypothetical protein ACI89U_002308, partial [Gammaproteobacteria bacterium]
CRYSPCIQLTGAIYKKSIVVTADFSPQMERVNSF